MILLIGCYNQQCHVTSLSFGINIEYSSALMPLNTSCNLSLLLNYAKRIVCMGKADNAVQLTKAFQDVTNQSISSQTLHHNLKSSGLRPVVKRKHPLFKPHH